MKKITITIILLLITITLSAQVQLYEGFYEGMTKKESKKELSQNKDKYSVIDFGKGVEWKIFKPGLGITDELYELHFLSSQGYVSGQNALVYLETTADVLKNMGYTVYLENENWKYPHYWAVKQYTHGLMLIDPKKTKIVHLYYSGTITIARMTIQSLKYTEQQLAESNNKEEVSGF